MPGARNVHAWDLGDSLISQKTAGYYGVQQYYSNQEFHTRTRTYGL